MENNISVLKELKTLFMFKHITKINNKYITEFISENEKDIFKNTNNMNLPVFFPLKRMSMYNKDFFKNVKENNKKIFSTYSLNDREKNIIIILGRMVTMYLSIVLNEYISASRRNLDILLNDKLEKTNKMYIITTSGDPIGMVTFNFQDVFIKGGG